VADDTVGALAAVAEDRERQTGKISLVAASTLVKALDSAPASHFEPE
jgi:hypothetical protein